MIQRNPFRVPYTVFPREISSRKFNFSSSIAVSPNPNSLFKSMEINENLPQVLYETRHHASRKYSSNYSPIHQQVWFFCSYKSLFITSWIRFWISLWFIVVYDLMIIIRSFDLNFSWMKAVKEVYSGWFQRKVHYLQFIVELRLFFEIEWFLSVWFARVFSVKMKSFQLGADLRVQNWYGVLFLWS